MEKTIQIDGKSVRFKSTAATPLRYKAQFGKDFFKDILKMFPLTKINIDDIEEDDEIMKIVLDNLDFDMFYNVLWSFAKTADKSLPEPIEWLDQFEEFPLLDIFPQVQDMIIQNLQTKKK